MSTVIDRPKRPVSRADFPLAIICALSLEVDAIEALFDEYWDYHIYSKAPGDPNSYSTGRIGHHNVVLAYMPEAGKANGAAVATNCRVSFPHVKLAIVVGICGVIPFTPGPWDAHHEIILGDVIVSQSVVQYDLGRQYPGSVEYKDTNEEPLGRPNVEIRSLLSKLNGLRARRAFESDMGCFLSLLQEDLELAAQYPEPGTDRLYEATYQHVDKDMPCDKCGCNGKLVPHSTGEGNLTRFLVPFPPNEDFVGRQDILESLRQELSLKRSHAVAALFGLGGTGKTQIALAYVHETHAQDPDLSVFWVYASNTERMRQSYAMIIQQFEIPRGENDLSDLELVKRWLEAKFHRPWLMVVDNADDLGLFYGTSGLSRYLPTCAQGQLLITTRNKQVAIRATKGRYCIEVPRMTESEAQELLGEHLGFLRPDFADLSTLVLKLEYLPLILVQAASFIKENSISISEYLNLLETDENLIQLLDEDFETDGRDPDSLQAVTKTWTISFRQIRRQNELAGDLLSLMSMFDHQNIPEEFLVTYLSLTYGDERTLERLRAIGLLKAFSFVSSGEDNSISMHRLIQLAMRRWLIKEDTMEYFLRKAILTIQGVSTLTSDDDTSTRVLHNTSHILIALSIFHSTFGANMWSRTNTLEMFKLTILAIYNDLIFHLGANGLAEEVLDIRLDTKKGRLGTEASAAIFAVYYHALYEERTSIIRQLEIVVHTWRFMLPPGTSNVWEICEADLRGYSSRRSA
ncbi:hypothetical protein H9L39_14400 [Fusarium oxysporum f. sp. albedinis]|nr:hypothetical protein H9L39_14400 [Fusarium oxysporum f. sp. albedinis]